MTPVVEMAVFAHVVEAGSFSVAARRLGTSKSSVSAQVQRLERNMGVRLLDRTTRRVSATEAGAAFYRHCARIVAEAQAASELADAFHDKPRGLVRVTAPDTLGWMHVAPAIPSFLQRFPDVSVDLSLSDAHVDLVAQRFDLAIRVGRVAQSSLVVRRLGLSRLVICASPAYLKEHGEPRLVRDIGRYACLVFTPLGWGDEWRLGAGVGLALLPDWMVGDELRAGRLVRILRRLAMPTADIHAVYPSGRLRAPKVTALVDHLAARIGRTLFGMPDT